MEFSKLDSKIFARLARHAKRYGVPIIRVREAFLKNLSQEIELHPEWDENLQKTWAYRTTTTWIINSYDYVKNSQCEDCIKERRDIHGCRLYSELRYRLSEVGPLSLFTEKENSQEIKEICELEDNVLKCRRRKTYVDQNVSPQFIDKSILHSENSREVNKPAIPKNQVSLQKYCT